MIEVSDACYEALLRDPVRLRPKARWRTSRTSGSDGIDVSDRVTEWGRTSQYVGPYLSSPSTADMVLTLDNSDGIFTTRSASGYFPNGPTDYYQTELLVEQEVLLDDGTVEPISIFGGLVQYIDPSDGIVEVKLAGRSSILRQSVAPEAITLSPINSSGYCSTLTAHMTDLMAVTPIAYGTDTIDTTLIPGLYLSRLGWQLSGGVLADAAIGPSLQELCRSALSVLLDGEDGRLRVVPLGWVRYYRGLADMPIQIDLPDIFAEPRAFNFKPTEGFATSATEVRVRYAGGATVRYRDTVAEATIGRRVQPPVSMEFLRTATHASFAARMIYEYHRDFPLEFTFIAPAYGMLAQIGDVARLRDTVTDTISSAIVVGKSWANPGMVQLAVRANPGLDSIFNATMAVYGTASWGDTVL